MPNLGERIRAASMVWLAALASVLITSFTILSMLLAQIGRSRNSSTEVDEEMTITFYLGLMAAVSTGLTLWQCASYVRRISGDTIRAQSMVAGLAVGAIAVIVAGIMSNRSFSMVWWWYLVPLVPWLGALAGSFAPWPSRYASELGVVSVTVIVLLGHQGMLRLLEPPAVPAEVPVVGTERAPATEWNLGANRLSGLSRGDIVFSTTRGFRSPSPPPAGETTGKLGVTPDASRAELLMRRACAGISNSRGEPYR